MPLKAKLHIETVHRGGRTILKNSFAGQPYKLANITEDKLGSCLQLMLMNSSPGILDGDEYHSEIVVGENCSLHLQTQSYQRLFTMKNGAKQIVNISLHAGASLIYLPHPLVPHKNSKFISKNNIHLQSSCELVWGEVLSCGRKENGEVFHFSSYQNITQIFMNGRLVVKENILLDPANVDLSSIGQLEGYSHQASLIFLNEEADVEELITALVDRLNEEENIAFGVSKLPVNGLIVRILGFKAEQLFNLLQAISSTLKPINQKTSVNKVHVA